MFTYVAAAVAIALLVALGLRDLIAPLRDRRIKQAYGAMIWIGAVALFALIWFNPEFGQSASILFSESAR